MKKILLASALLAASFGVNAATINSLDDNFDYFTSTQLNVSSLDNWVIKSGAVDAIFTPNNHGLACNTGGCIDLDGSINAAGTLESKFGFSAGQYTLSFDLSGNQRGGADDSLIVTFGDYTQTFNLASDAAWTTIVISLVNVNEGDKLSFSHAGSDNMGILLDNVSVSAVPLPAAAFLFAPALLGFMGLRRRKAKIA